MLECYRIDVCQGVDVNKTNGLCESIICHYRYFLEINFRFQSKVCDGCHDLMQKAMSKDDAINLLRNGYLTEKSRVS